MVDRALGYPGAWIDHPWGESVVKVGKKVFVFLADRETPSTARRYVGVKLTDALDHALSLSGVDRMGYGLGKYGWVSAAFEPEVEPDHDLIAEWLDESYRNVATKTLIRELDTRSG